MLPAENNKLGTPAKETQPLKLKRTLQLLISYNLVFTQITSTNWEQGIHLRTATQKSPG